MALHLIKLCVGAETVEDLTSWQDEVMARNAAAGRPALPTHVTRMWPKRADELLAGGSLYWVFKGLVLCRQRILSLDPRQGEDGIQRCATQLDSIRLLNGADPQRPIVAGELQGANLCCCCHGFTPEFLSVALCFLTWADFLAIS